MINFATHGLQALLTFIRDLALHTPVGLFAAGFILGSILILICSRRSEEGR